jgi:hypothetical protein
MAVKDCLRMLCAVLAVIAMGLAGYGQNKAIQLPNAIGKAEAPGKHESSVSASSELGCVAKRPLHTTKNASPILKHLWASHWVFPGKGVGNRRSARSSQSGHSREQTPTAQSVRSVPRGDLPRPRRTVFTSMI